MHIHRHGDRPLRRAVHRTGRLAAGSLLALLAAGASLYAAERLNPLPTPDPAAESVAVQAVAPGPVVFPLFGRRSDGRVYDYEPTDTGTLKAMVDMGGGYQAATAIVQANVSEGGKGNDLYHRMGGTLYYTAEHGNDTKVIGGGWDIYNLLVSVGNMGGSPEPDLLARDAAGALWIYQGKPDGTLQARVQAGTGGWNGMDALVGRGDYTGDGRADLLARSTTGTLYVYPGTGSATANAVLTSRLTLTGTWTGYGSLVSNGDLSGDGKTDLIASDTAGALWLLKGTGTANAPFAPRVRIGTGGWTAYTSLF
ncbi:FG-GAP repeat domain-containing protein [Streptomyces sp. NPDC056503]|uniref:FG-GAP repeat domain-containing protein n=1 Tax=Streptomyces sp. NPDC056503 TaxID=3345842 RepID=UPI0036A8138A